MCLDALGCTWMPQMIDSITVVIGWISNVMCCVKYSMLSDSTLSKDLGEISPRIRRGSTNSNRFQGGVRMLSCEAKIIYSCWIFEAKIASVHDIPWQWGDGPLLVSSTSNSSIASGSPDSGGTAGSSEWTNFSCANKWGLKGDLGSQWQPFPCPLCELVLVQLQKRRVVQLGSSQGMIGSVQWKCKSFGVHTCIF